MRKFLLFMFLLAMMVSLPAFAEDDSHGNGHGDGHEEDGDGAVELTLESMKEAGIVVETLVKLNLKGEINAPGEVRLNSYLSSKITPRITAQVVARHARLGDKVKRGKALLTMSSVEMAEAVGELLIAHKEWERLQKLGKKAVSAKRYTEARVVDTQARAKVIAYGMTSSQVEDLLSKGSSLAPGNFQLVALQEGVIVSDDFIEGELIEPGRILFNIVNESSLWVESRLSVKQSEEVEVGAIARVHAPGNSWLQGKVVQKHRLLDEETRTIGIRIEVNNEADKLHPGMFVDTKIQVGKGNKHLAVPTESVLRSPDGDWIVFVEEDEAGHFKPEEVEAIKTIGGYTVIEGLPEGTRVVTSGAFFVRSELVKSGFDVHNH